MPLQHGISTVDSILNMPNALINSNPDSQSIAPLPILKTPEQNTKKTDSIVDNYNKLLNRKSDKIADEEQGIQQISPKYIKKVDSKIEQYNTRLTKKTEKTLERLSKWEDKIHSLLQKTNPSAAQHLFGNGQMTFSVLLQKIKQGESMANNYVTEYNSYNDKLTTNLKYMCAQKNKLDSEIIKPVMNANKKMAQLNQEEDNTQIVQQFIKERKKQLITGALQYLHNSKYLAKINQEAFYYSESLKNYKELFSNSDKVEDEVKNILNKIPAFQNFFHQNSMLASLFKMNSSASPSSLTNTQLTTMGGLQTRAQVQSLIQQQIPTISGGTDAQQILSQNIQQAQSQMGQLRDKISKIGSSDNSGMPEFKPNMQKTKTLRQRLEFGTNIQFAKSNQWVPSTANIAMTVGYKLTDKSTVGIGMSYNLGIGTIHRINFSNEGIGLRSFFDWKFKKQLSFVAGFEMNNNPALDSVSVPSYTTLKLESVGSWQKSALVGVSKKLSIKSKFFKATSVQLLYDFLCNQHIPKSQPFLFRMGYNF